MKKLLLVSLLAVSTFAIIGCKGNKKKDSEDDGKIQVNYYIDYNAITSGEVYYTYREFDGSKLQEPTKPTEAPFPEFPVFKGWSKKELIDNDADLWNFATDEMHVKEGYRTFNLFGIWVAEGA